MFRFLLKPLSFVPALCVMYMIFSFSAQTADESGQLSMLVSEKVVLLLGKLTSGNLDTAQVGVYADEIHFLVRKMAHFSEYLFAGADTFPALVCLSAAGRLARARCRTVLCRVCRSG